MAFDRPTVRAKKGEKAHWYVFHDEEDYLVVAIRTPRVAPYPEKEIDLVDGMTEVESHILAKGGLDAYRAVMESPIMRVYHEGDYLLNQGPQASPIITALRHPVGHA